MVQRKREKVKTVELKGEGCSRGGYVEKKGEGGFCRYCSGVLPLQWNMEFVRRRVFQFLSRFVSFSLWSYLFFLSFFFLFSFYGDFKNKKNSPWNLSHTCIFPLTLHPQLILVFCQFPFEATFLFLLFCPCPLQLTSLLENFMIQKLVSYLFSYPIKSPIFHPDFKIFIKYLSLLKLNWLS